jgi:glycosyltransferase involved in cell wall biosynthesis
VIDAEGAVAAPRILLAVQVCARDGGSGTHVLDSAAVLRDRGWEVAVVAESLEPGLQLGFPVHLVAGLGAHRVVPEAVAQLRTLLNGPHDVLHVHDLPDMTLSRAVHGRAAVVVSVHNFMACTPGNYYFRPGQECTRHHGPGCWANMAARGCAHTLRVEALPRRYRDTTRRVEALRTADAVVAYSEFVAQHLRRNAVEPMVVPLVVPLVNEPSPPASPARILFAGRLVKNKGLGVLLAALRQLDTHLDVYGSGWWESSAHRTARRLGVADRVTFHGWASEEELAAAYARAAVVVMPSLWPEPFGLTGVEGLARGRPVVATSTGGIPEWLLDGVNGYLVAPNDEQALGERLAELLADAGLRDRLGAAGRSMVRDSYSPAAHGDAIGAVYRAAVSARDLRESVRV